LHIREQNAAVIVRAGSKTTTFEIFEVCLPNKEVMAAEHRLLCDFPAHSVDIPSPIFRSISFQNNISTFLCAMDVDKLDSAATTTKAGSKVEEVRDTTDPHYITELLVGILHGLHGAKPGVINRITKRVADDILWDNTCKPWRRSPLWLILRVALQTSLPHLEYKAFMALFLSAVLSLSCSDSGQFSSDLLRIMCAKIARRMAKLGSSAPAFVSSAVADTFRAAENIMCERWIAVQRTRSQAAPWDPTSALDLHPHTQLTLQNSADYLRQILDHEAGNTHLAATAPSHSLRLRHETDFHRFSDGHLSSSVQSTDPAVALYDFEQSVFDSLAGWVKGEIDARRETACAVLFSCLEQYIAATKKHYASSNPLEQSYKLLTVLAIWVGIDRLVVAEHPILSEYSPQIPASFLEPLLLRDEQTLRLATTIEGYIQRRHSQSGNLPSVFSESTAADSFPVRYFMRSVEMNTLMHTIERDAQAERTRTRAKLRELNTEYKSLENEADCLSHEYYSQWIRHRSQYEGVHSNNCRRCDLEHRYKNLFISVHEWPLPHDKNEAMRVVFELYSPFIFSIWRDTTFLILHDIGGHEEVTSANPSVTLTDYSPLAGYSPARARTSRITIASSTKSFLRSHYHSRSIPTSNEDTILVNNGLTFRLFDLTDSTWASQSFSSSSLAQCCSTSLPAGSKYAHLQRALNQTTHTSNSVIADQSSCPKELTLHEYVSFGSLRSGGRLQWMNISRELRARTLSFNDPEVHLLLMQAMWQIGPSQSETGRRDWHADLKDTTFCQVLLRESREFLRSVGENWEKGILVRTTSKRARFLISALADKAQFLSSFACWKRPQTKRSARMHTTSCVLRAPSRLS
jgi:hypothetical protein